VVVDGDPEEADLALVAQGVEGLQPVALVGPPVVPHVQLEEVDRVRPEVAQGPLRAAADVVAGKGVLDGCARLGRPDEVLRRHLRGHVDRLRAVADDLADELLAVALAVGQRRVDEVQPELDRAPQGAQGLVVLRADPLRLADPPGAVADLGYL
jgi:hypothetical protein